MSSQAHLGDQHPPFACWDAGNLWVPSQIQQLSPAHPLLLSAVLKILHSDQKSFQGAMGSVRFEMPISETLQDLSGTETRVLPMSSLSEHSRMS